MSRRRSWRSWASILPPTCQGGRGRRSRGEAGPLSGGERALEGAALLAGLVPAARLVARGAFRRAFPAAALGIGAILLAGAAGLVVAALVLPPAALRAATGLALTGLVAAAWQARPGRGSVRGWPPGSLGFLPSIELLLDPRAYQDRAAAHGPVFKSRQFRQPMVCVVGLDRAHALLRDHDGDLSVPALPFDGLVPGRFLRYMERDEHRVQRPIIAETLASGVVERRAPFLAGVAREALAAMARESRADHRGVPPREGLQGLVHAQAAGLFLGVEPGTDDGRTLARLYHRLDPNTTSRRGLARERRALAAIRGLVEERVDRWGQGEPGPDCFLHTLFERRPEAARDPTTVGNLILLVATTRVDVGGLLAWILVELGAAPAWNARVGDAPSSVSVPVVQETLRLHQSEYVYRRVERPVTIDGHTVPAGWLVRVCVRESHRDPAKFVDPDRFDPARFAEHPPSPRTYSPFGASRHGCLGRGITLEIGRIFVEELARGFDWTIVADGPPELGGRHWNHWRPSRRLRIRIEARSA